MNVQFEGLNTHTHTHTQAHIKQLTNTLISKHTNRYIIISSTGKNVVDASFVYYLFIFGASYHHPSFSLFQLLPPPLDSPRIPPSPSFSLSWSSLFSTYIPSFLSPQILPTYQVQNIYAIFLTLFPTKNISTNFSNLPSLAELEKFKDSFGKIS